MITVYGRANSSNVQFAMWVIGELGLAHERIDCGGKYGGNDTPEFLAMNPNGRVPLIRDGDGEPLWESGAIARYLAAKYGDDDFWPKDAAARAQVDKWAEWGKAEIAANFTMPLFWAIVRTPEGKRDRAAIERAVARFDQLLGIAEAQLSRSKYLAADRFTLADCAFGHVLYRYFDMDLPRPARPALDAYYKGLTERPAFREHVMVSYEELRAR